MKREDQKAAVAAYRKREIATGITLAYDSFGEEAAEAILLISGLGTQMIRWADPFCREVAALGYRVIRFDNRDAGRSTSFAQYGTVDIGTLVSLLMAGQQPPVAYTLADMAADAIGLLDALSIPQAHVVGRSMGGMIAQVMASEHPSRILSLTSIMSSTGNPALPSGARAALQDRCAGHRPNRPPFAAVDFRSIETTSGR